MPRPRTQPISNSALADAIERTGATYSAIADMLNQVAAENDHLVRATAATLGKWLNGATPSPAMMAVAVEAFARLLDEPELSSTGLGWELPGGRDASSDPWSGDPVTWLLRLGRDDMLNRRTLMASAALYSLTAATPPAHAAIFERTGPARSAGRSDVERIRTATHQFGVMDDLYGGGHARTAVAAYLVHDVAPLLRGTSGRARPSLFSAAAELVYLLAWMAADDLKTGLAQRYYVQAVRLADEAGNPVLRSTALRSLAVQAVELGHAETALDLADAAASGLRAGAPTRTRAWVTGMRAEALAARDRDGHRSVALLRSTEILLDRADSLPEAELTGTYRQEAYQHQVGLTLTQLGDLPGAEQAFAASIASRRPTERRTLALVAARLAEVQLRQGRPVDAARTVLDSRGAFDVSSQRVINTLRKLRAGWQVARTDDKVQQADQLLACLV
ncbi:hypothetical protein [Actinomadura atramentaria]|uniref:hypothetical protein n=1 Tax=Actinomadura atramentaria TaxID=1990 RepID=UPI0003A0862F|nr:hypothetical protein [Actinomadura atramentaria]